MMTVRTASKKPDAMIAKALVFHRKGELDEAGRIYEKILSAFPENPDALHLKGLVALKKGDPRKAVLLITQAITAGGERPAYLSNLAAALSTLGMYERAIQYAERARSLGLSTPEASVVRAEALLNLGRTEQALAVFEEVYRVAPDNPKGFSGLLVSLERVERLDEVCDRLTRHIERFGETDEWLLRLAIAFRRKGDFEMALNALDRSKDKSQINWIVNYFKALLELGRISDAIPLGQALLEGKNEIALSSSDPGFTAGTIRNSKAPLKPFDPLQRERNVICFSLWGSDPKYTFTAVLNAKTVPLVYPGWTARFYCDDSVPAEILTSLRDYGAQVQMVANDPRPNLALLWRFIASDDPTIDRFICRDCDAVVNLREKAAVDEWISSGKRFHVMRDHPEHAELIMAGMWGGVAGIMPELARHAVEYYETHSTRDRWVDQDFLRDRVWPAIIHDCLVHDEIYVMGGETRHFPAGSKLPDGHHVGGYQPRNWVPKEE